MYYKLNLFMYSSYSYDYTVSYFASDEYLFERCISWTIRYASGFHFSYKIWR